MTRSGLNYRLTCKNSNMDTAVVPKIRRCSSGCDMIDETNLITWGEALRVYWTVFWRSVAIWMLIALLLELLPFLLLATGNMDDMTHWVLNRILSFLALVCGSFIAFRMALQKQYRSFRIQIVRDFDKE